MREYEIVREGTVLPFERLVLVYDIRYDYDNDINAPTRFKVKVPANLRDEELENYLSDYISDETGYAHDGFSYELI